MQATRDGSGEVGPRSINVADDGNDPAAVSQAVRATSALTGRFLGPLCLQDGLVVRASAPRGAPARTSAQNKRFHPNAHAYNY
jgi:hypothetical protein